MVSKLADQYQKNGFVSGIQIISMREAWAHRNRLEQAENQVGALHYKSKVHTPSFIVALDLEMGRLAFE